MMERLALLRRMDAAMLNRIHDETKYCDIWLVASVSSETPSATPSGHPTFSPICKHPIPILTDAPITVLAHLVSGAAVAVKAFNALHSQGSHLSNRAWLAIIL